jgi:spermidine/putrescine transport system permease protein
VGIARPDHLLDDVVITQLRGGPIYHPPVYVFGLVRRGVTPLINAVSVVMLGASMVLVAVSFGFQRNPRSRVQSSSRS